MINTILFDLDGTLLPMDMDKFGQIYFHEIGSALADIANPKKLIKDIWTATEAMVKSTDNRTNEEVFMEEFSKLIDQDLKVYTDRFDLFYDSGFLKVRESVLDVPIIHEFFDLLKQKNYTLVLATNPLFPRKAIHHRIKWAGLQPQDFSYITSFEENHYCKPQPHYYREILSQIGKKPEECLMVGNDVQEDGIAEALGIKTFLITNHLLHRTGDEINCTYKGTYEDFHGFVQNLSAL